MVRHFAERGTAIPGLTSFGFSGFRMASRLHSSLASVVDGKELPVMNNAVKSSQSLMPGVVPTTDGLEIAIHHGEEGSVVRLHGRLNIDSSPALRDRLLALLRAQSPEAVIVDLRDVHYIDSSGIATLIEGLRMARMRATTLCVQGLQGRLLHLFQVTGISTLFEKSGCGSASSVSQVS